MANEEIVFPLDVSASDWAGAQLQFLTEGVECSREWLAGLDTRFDAPRLSHQLQRWAGLSGQFGFHAIAESARRTERLLAEAPVRLGEVRERLSDLLLTFSGLRNRLTVAVPDHVAQSLRGMSAALVGFPSERANRACAALVRVSARPRLYPTMADLECASLRECDLVIVHVGRETDSARLKAAAEGFAAGKLFLTGDRGILLALPAALQALVADYLFPHWEPDELLLRLTLSIWRKAASPLAKPVASEVVALRTSPHGIRSRVLVVDDDPIVLALLGPAFRNHGMECQTVDNGGDALRLIREKQPDAVVLDVNMPGMDGYEVLSAIRAEELPTQVLLLTARQHEEDVLRGFQLGADDYLVKPFNPRELIARVRRLLRPAYRVAA